LSGSEEPLEPIVSAGAGELDVAKDSEVLASASIVVVSGATAGKIYPLLGPDLIIGRGSGAHIRIDEKPVSSKHARILRSQDGHSLVDLGSTNGTFLNARRLTPNDPTELMPGDSIQVAETVLAYLPAGQRNPQEQTQYLSKLMPQMPGSTALRLSDGGSLPEVQMLARLLQSTSPQVEAPPVTIEERIEGAMKILRIVRRNWIVLFSAIALGALLGNIRPLLTPPLAEASFRIRITPNSTNAEMKEYDRDNRGFYTGVDQAFKNRALVEQTLKSLGRKEPGKTETDLSLARLGLESVAFMTFEGKFQSRDPEFAVKFLRFHLENFLNAEVNKVISVVQTEVNFLTAQVKERDAELTKTEQALKEFKSQHLEGLPEFTSGHVTSREALYARRADLSAQMTKANLELQAARQRLKEAAPMDASKVAAAAPFEASLVDVKRKLAELRGKGLGDQHPDVVALLKQQENLERLSNEAKARDSSGLEQRANLGLTELKNRVTDLEVQARGTGAELGGVNGQLERLDGIVKTMPEVEARYAELTRSYAANKDIHTKLFEDLRHAQLNLDLERAQARARYEVITPVESSGVPLRQALMKGALMGGALGLLIGALISALFEFRRFLKARRTGATSTAIVPAGAQPPWIQRR